MKSNTGKSKAQKNYYVDIIALFPFLLLLTTGIIMLVYHTGKPYPEKILGLNGNIWLTIHQILAGISFIMICIHLIMHFNWLKKLFSRTLKNKHWRKNLTLLILFTATLLSSVFPWLIMGDTDLATEILGIHNKIGLALIAFFALHIISYFKWLVNMTKKVLIK